MSNAKPDTPKRQIRLNAFLMATGHHVAAWRHPGGRFRPPGFPLKAECR